MKKVFFLLCVIWVHAAQAQSVSIRFTNVRCSEGVFRVGFFTDQESYKSGNPKYYITVSKYNFCNGEILCDIDSIEPGVYGLIVLDDENSNNKTDYGFLIPTEGFGFSNYIVDKVRVPDFKDFAFLLNTNKIRVTIQMKYL